jgi:hypothetical protein
MCANNNQIFDNGQPLLADRTDGEFVGDHVCRGCGCGVCDALAYYCDYCDEFYCAACFLGAGHLLRCGYAVLREIATAGDVCDVIVAGDRELLIRRTCDLTRDGQMPPAAPPRERDPLRIIAADLEREACRKLYRYAGAVGARTAVNSFSTSEIEEVSA